MKNPDVRIVAPTDERVTVNAVMRAVLESLPKTSTLSPGLQRALDKMPEDARKKLGDKPQYVAHDGAGARARRLRQMQARAEKAVKQHLGVSIDVTTGRTKEGLVVVEGA